MTNKKTKTNIDTKKVEKQLLKTQFPKECEQIPLDALEEEEKNVVNKCLNHEEFNDEEFKLLKKTLVKYRKYIEKYDVEETIDATEKAKELILTEKDWLDLVDNTHNILKVNVPYNGNWYEMEFEVLPLIDSRVVSALQTHINVFKDYSQKELTLFQQAEKGKTLTPEEQAIVNKMMKEINERAGEDRIKSMNEFLAAQLKLPNSTENLETRKEFWSKFPFVTKSAIMLKVEDRLGLSEISNEQLFPDE
jgi:hypothetical protein